MARAKLRSPREVADRCRLLADELSTALGRLPAGADDPTVIDAIWRGEALGTLLWALGRIELPPYDEPFDSDALLAVDAEGGKLRDADEIERERDAARVWHWRARTAELQTAVETGGRPVELPERYASLDQLIAATAMRGYQQGLLPAPMRGDFRAYDKVYRHISPEQRIEAASIALERHHALNWVCGLGESWDSVPLDT
jgi:hypothetical protein